MALNLIKFDPELHAKLRILAATKRVTIGELMETLVKQAVELHNKERETMK